MSTHSNLQLCRLCGYIRNNTEDGNACPACGAPSTSFVPCQHNISPNRRRYLDLDVHPVTVHFTISYTLSLAILFVLSFITPTFLGIPLRDSGILDFFIRLLPIFVVAAGVTGLLDGKMRYRKLRTRFLTIKMILGAILIGASIIALAAHLASGGGAESNFLSIKTVVILSSALLAAILGRIGSKLTCPIVPRSREL